MPIAKKDFTGKSHSSPSVSSEMNATVKQDSAEADSPTSKNAGLRPRNAPRRQPRDSRADVFTVFKSRAGFGLRTQKDIEKGDLVIEYKGKKITNEKAEEKPNRYLFDLDEKWTIDGSGRSNTARYINHSCRPNCEAVHYTDTNEIGIEAIKNIKAGEELTYDYGKAHFEEYIKPYGCKCEKCQTALLKTR